MNLNVMSHHIKNVVIQKECQVLSFYADDSLISIFLCFLLEHAPVQAGLVKTWSSISSLILLYHLWISSMDYLKNVARRNVLT